MKCSSALASMLPSGRNGVSMIGERQITCRSTTTNRLDRPSDWRFNVTRAKRRCEVELPISMPTVRSSSVSCSQIARAIASRSASDISSCSCSSSKSCMGALMPAAAGERESKRIDCPPPSRRRPDRARRLNHASQPVGRQGKNAGLVEDVAHLRRDAGAPDRFEPFAVDARILVLVLDLAPALLHRNRAAALRALAPERNERIASAAKAAREITRRLRAGVEVLVEHPERRRVHEPVLPRKFLELGIPLIPQQGISLAVDRVHVSASGMAMRLLVAAGRYLRHMRVHGSVSKHKAHVHRPFSARLELVELEACEVVHEVRLP